MAYKNNLITGITELLVLKILEQQDSYVYEIQKMINNHSEHWKKRIWLVNTQNVSVKKGQEYTTI